MGFGVRPVMASVMASDIEKRESRSKSRTEVGICLAELSNFDVFFYSVDGKTMFNKRAKKIVYDATKRSGGDVFYYLVYNKFLISKIVIDEF